MEAPKTFFARGRRETAPNLRFRDEFQLRSLVRRVVNVSSEPRRKMWCGSDSLTGVSCNCEAVLATEQPSFGVPPHDRHKSTEAGTLTDHGKVFEEDAAVDAHLEQGANVIDIRFDKLPPLLDGTSPLEIFNFTVRVRLDAHGDGTTAAQGSDGSPTRTSNRDRMIQSRSGERQSCETRTTGFLMFNSLPSTVRNRSRGCKDDTHNTPSAESLASVATAALSRTKVQTSGCPSVVKSSGATTCVRGRRNHSVRRYHSTSPTKTGSS